MAQRVLDVTVDAGRDGRTIGAILKQEAGVSNSVARGIIAAGRVKRNDEIVTDPAGRAVFGDVIVARFDPRVRHAAPPARRREVGFTTILEDKTFVVVDKPAGVLTVRMPDSDEETLVGRVGHSHKQRGLRWAGLRAVHRIDRMTSGLVLLTRTAAARADLIQQFARREPLREYVAVCEGTVDPPADTLISWLVEDPRTHKVRPATDRAAGQEATLHYQRVEALPGATLVRVRLETGRHNQIRAQFAERGWPLLGDRTYGRASPLIDRVALHAERLAFNHPVTGRRVDAVAPLPADFERLLRLLRSGARDQGVAQGRSSRTSR